MSEKLKARERTLEKARERKIDRKKARERERKLEREREKEKREKGRVCDNQCEVSGPC